MLLIRQMLKYECGFLGKMAIFNVYMKPSVPGDWKDTIILPYTKGKVGRMMQKLQVGQLKSVGKVLTNSIEMIEEQSYADD